MKVMIDIQDAIKAVTMHLDRINCTSEGTMRGVAYNWLKDIETMVIEDGQENGGTV